MNDMALPEAALGTARHIGLAGSTAIIVLGMHRSGTSALAGTLHHLGVALGHRLMKATPDNPRGYWEHLDLVDAHHQLMAGFGLAWDDVWAMPHGYAESDAAIQARRKLATVVARDFAGTPLWALKDPRMCRLVELWLPLLDEAAVEARFILMLRHPGDVAASLAARDRLGAARAGLLWLRHVLEAERGTRGRRRAIVHYEDLVAGGGWRDAMARIAGEIGIAWPDSASEAAVDDYLAPELRHHRTAEAGRDVGAGSVVGHWIETVYEAFATPAEGLLRDTCDTVARELEHAEETFLPLLDEGVRKSTEAAQAAQSEAQATIEDLTRRLTQAKHEAAELRAIVGRTEMELGLLKRSNSAAGRSAKAVGTLPVEEAYPQWIENRATAALARPDWTAERIAAWPSVPKAALGMIVLAGNEARVVLTLASLARQTLADWELHVVAESPMPDAFAGDERLRWHRAEGPIVSALNRRLGQSAADWVGLVDAGDQLAAHALFSVADAFFRHPEWHALYSDEDRIDRHGVRSGPHFKPDFNLDLLRSLPYVGGLMAMRRTLFAETGGFDPKWDGAEDYDLALRLAERLGGAGFGHVADVLYHRSTQSGRSRRPVADVCADMPRVVQAHLDRAGVAATAGPGAQPYFCRVGYRHEGPEPLVSIVIPSRDQLPLLKRCIETVLQKTEYQNYELIIVDNGTVEPDACQYLQNIEDKFAEIGSRVRVLRHPGAFNFSAMNNRAVRESARGDYVCLLNNDAAPLQGDWLGEMMALARRPEVGIVGAKLFYADGRIQHAGVVLGVGFGSPAEHPFNGDPGNSFGYWGRSQVVQDFSAVTAACLVVRRSVYDEIGGLDEKAFAVAYNDIDFCLRVRAAGYLVVWTPFAQLLHDGSASLKANVERKATEEKNARFQRERIAMFQRWMPQIAFDPAYNRNLSSLGYGFAVETEGAPTWDPEFRPRPRVVVYPADREGCGEYRVIAPSRALFDAGVLHSYETMRLAMPPEIARVAPDSVVLQRQLEWHQIAYIEQLKQTSPALRVFELDDLITNLPPRSVHRKAIAADIGERLKKALSLCNRLVVSTEPLARAYGRLCDEVVVLPNRLEKARWSALAPKRRPQGKPRVGWAGAVGHTGDLALISSVVEATAKEVDWVFFGMCPDNLKRFVAEDHEWVLLRDYPRRLAALDLDLAVAPLEPHPFNEAKSNLRLLEYGILGYPVLCSDILPYQGDLPVTRVANRSGAWIKAIREMAADREACRRAGERLREAVAERWMLEDGLDEWQKAWLP
jgi:GT2 family glycosyltransferase